MGETLLFIAGGKVNCVATVEITMEVSQNTNNGANTQPHYGTPEINPVGVFYIHHRCLYNSKEMKSAYTIINRSVGTENTWNFYLAVRK